MGRFNQAHLMCPIDEYRWMYFLRGILLSTQVTLRNQSDAWHTAPQSHAIIRALDIAALPHA